jgi:hypothetical protein
VFFVWVFVAFDITRHTPVPPVGRANENSSRAIGLTTISLQMISAADALSRDLRARGLAPHPVPTHDEDDDGDDDDDDDDDGDDEHDGDDNGHAKESRPPLRRAVCANAAAQHHGHSERVKHDALACWTASGSPSAAAAHHNLPVSDLYSFREQAARGPMQRGRQRRPGAGRAQLLSKELETQLADEVRAKRRVLKRVPRKFVLQRARELAEAAGVVGFRASLHWLHDFFDRNNLSFHNAVQLLRLPAGVKEPSDLHGLAATSLAAAWNERQRHSLQPADVLCLDETPLEFESHSGTVDRSH